MPASISTAVMPLAYRPPTMAPMLVPAMQSMGIFRSSRILSTPMCAMPRAPPPDSTRQIRGRVAGSPAQNPAYHNHPAPRAQANPNRKMSFPMWGASLVHDVDTGSSKGIGAPVVHARGHEAQSRRRRNDGLWHLGHETREGIVHGNGGRVRGRCEVADGKRG